MNEWWYWLGLGVCVGILLAAWECENLWFWYSAQNDLPFDDVFDAKEGG